MRTVKRGGNRKFTYLAAAEKFFGCSLKSHRRICHTGVVDRSYHDKKERDSMSKKSIVPQFRLRAELEQLKHRTRRPLYELAAEVGMHDSRLSKILTGYAQARPDEQQRLSDLVDVPIHRLFTRLNNRKKEK
jgi:hypothetical protein